MNTSDLALLKAYIPLKKYTGDIAVDILYILNDRFNRYKKYLDDFSCAQMKSAIADFASIADNIEKRSNAFRAYIFTDIQRALYVSIELDESEVKKITDYVNSKIIGCPKKFRAKPEYVITLYIFKNNTPLFVQDIYATELSQITVNYRKYDIMLHKMK